MSRELICGSCGKKLLTYEIYTRKYGSPLKECKKCGAQYIDPRFHELAAEGLPEAELKLSPAFVIMVFGGLVLWRGIHLTGMRELGVPEETQWFMPTMFIILGALLIIGGIVEIILIKCGAKEKKFKRLYEESRQRLSDKEYAHRLSLLGYPVPEEFM